MLELKNVSKFYYNKGMITSGFTKINLELKMGEFAVITGESGSGKSTLLNVLSGLDSYEEGEMYVNGQETSHYTEKDLEEYRRKYIANIFQSFNLVNSYTVYQNVELVLLLNGYKKKDVKRKILDIIEQVGLTKFKNTKVSKLSGGQKQRVAIARAIVKDTPIIVADEPTGNLDTKSAADVLEILKKVSKGKLVIVVTHNLEQMEQYATRIIKMHDGKIIENKEIKSIEGEQNTKESKYHKITIFNKYRLGIRNTFNLFTKFILLFVVFFFIASALLLEYSAFKLSEQDLSKIGYNVNFRDLSENRILLKKKNKKAFSNKDFKKMKGLANVDYIVEDDLFIDNSVRIYRNDIFFYGYMNNIENFRGKVDLGRMPKKDDEIIVLTSKEQHYVKNFPNEILDKTFTIGENSEEKYKVRIVGIQYQTEDDNYDAKFFLSSKMLGKLRSRVNKNYSTMKVLFNNKYMNNNYFNIVPSDKVAKDDAIVSGELRYQMPNGVILNKKLKIQVSNIYYSETLNLKVSNTYTKNNFKILTGYDKYLDYYNAIFINKEQYENLYNKQSYQASLYVKDTKLIDQTIQELEQMGITTKKITDFKVDDGAIYNRIIQVIKVVVTIVLVIVLLFISYFIIKIILKSRNVYYTTLRMLGANYKTIKRILDIELWINSSLAFLATIGFIQSIKAEIITIPFIAKLINYLELKEYILMYLIIIVMARLISCKFSKKLFKNTAINTYNEEV